MERNRGGGTYTSKALRVEEKPTWNRLQPTTRTAVLTDSRGRRRWEGEVTGGWNKLQMTTRTTVLTDSRGHIRCGGELNGEGWQTGLPSGFAKSPSCSKLFQATVWWPPGCGSKIVLKRNHSEPSVNRQ